MKGSTVALVRRLEAQAPMNVVRELSQRACERDVEALDALARYALDGRLIGIRDSVVASLAELASPNAPFLEGNFREWLQPTSRKGQQYWAVLGLINVLGSAVYPEFIAIASNESLPTDVRAHAVKLLAAHSSQTFDAAKPTDPGHWQVEDIDSSRLNIWASSGYPRGTGHVVPISDPALLSPVTTLELAASHLDRLLQKQRQERFDPANPSNLLVQAAPDIIGAIEKHFRLPANYLEFLGRFSPLNVVLEGRRFSGLQLYGATDLVSGQLGYSTDALTNQPVADWPGSMIVVGNDGGDPYTLDLSRASVADAPICSAPHGSGSWKFKDVAPSFVDFLERLR
jgi:hypothetical protein